MTDFTCRACSHGIMRGVGKRNPYSGRFECPLTGNTDAMRDADLCPKFSRGETTFVDAKGNRLERKEVPWL